MLMGLEGGPVGRSEESNLDVLFEPEFEAISSALGAPEASVISKLHYRPGPSKSLVRISMLAQLKECHQTVIPRRIRPPRTIAKAGKWIRLSLSRRKITAKTTVINGYALEIGTTREAFPPSRANEYA